MPKLLNGRPMDELVCDGRPVLVIDTNDLTYLIRANSNLAKSIYVEWMEIIRPDPKPDANGWYKSSEIQPDQEGKSVLIMHKAGNAGHIIKYWRIEQYCVDPEIYSHWRYIDLPVET